MTLQQLKYIHAIAKYGSSLEASKHLFVSQPSISAAVSSFEKEIGFTVFKRSKFGMVPTTEGNNVIREVDKIIASVDKLQSLRNNVKDRLTIGFRTQYEYKLITNSILAMYLQNIPVNIATKWFATADDFFMAIEQGIVDGVLINSDDFSCGWKNTDIAKHALTYSIIGTDKLGFLTSREHPAARKPNALFKDVAVTPFVSLYPESSELWKDREKFLHAHGYAQNTLFIENIAEIDRIVASINGFTTLYRSDYEKRSQEFKKQYALIFPSDMDMHVDFYWIRRPDNLFPINEIDGILKEEFQKMLID